METRSPNTASSVQIGIAIADIVQMCTNSGTRNAAETCVASVPPNPGMTRTASKNAGDPTLNRETQPGSRAIWRSRSSSFDVRNATAYPNIAAHTIPIALTTEPHSGPNRTPFMTASASVTENGADATTVNM